MAAIMAVLRSCMETVKSILTSQEFGSEYELLCAELSTQWLRIRLWGESVGLHINDAGHLQNSIFKRPDIESTISQCANSIAYLLTEIEVLRRKYELRPPLIPAIDQDKKSIRACKSLSTLSDFRRPASSIRQRMRDNQKQTSFLAITKWALCDAKRFDEKVKRLKSLVDGLEDISQAAGIAQSHPGPRRSSTAPATTTPAENPPPYSLAPPPAQRARPIPEPVTPSATTPVTLDPGILAHHVSLKRFIGLSSQAGPVNPRSERARPKLMGLTNNQFKELRADVYDEMMRRECEPATSSLPDIASYHGKRNQARLKLSTLSLRRFKDLTTDVVFELERRFTSLQLQVIDELERAVHVSDMSVSPRRHSTRRYGRVEPHTPPPLLRHRASHPACFSRPVGPNAPARVLTITNPNSTKQPPTSHYSSSFLPNPIPAPNPPVPTIAKAGLVSPPCSSSPSVEIFKSFRVSMEDPTHKVLPAALKKYNISADPDTYALYICYGDNERCLGLDEKPLILFKKMDKEGLKPMFMLRRIVPSEASTALVPKTDVPGGIM